MAKKKMVPEEPIQELDNSVDTASKEEIEQTLESAVSASKNNEESAEIQEEQEIPEYADKLLKAYSDYDKLYIDNKGGVFSKDTQGSLVKGAVLYKNPYYNK